MVKSSWHSYWIQRGPKSPVVSQAEAGQPNIAFEQGKCVGLENANRG